MAGWIKLHRSTTENFLWSKEPFSKGQAWIDLLLHANFTDNEIMLKCQVIHIQRGQQARSEYTLSKDWKWSKNKVRRFLELLRSQSMIETKSTPLTTIITICNYERFQGGDTTDETSNGTTLGTTDGLHTATSKEGNKEKKVKKQPSSNKFNDDDMTTAKYIFSLIQHLDQSIKEPNYESWANTIRLMVERDGRAHKEICQVFKWANNDSFWSINILSASKLREKYDQLKLKMNQPQTQSNFDPHKMSNSHQGKTGDIL